MPRPVPDHRVRLRTAAAPLIAALALLGLGACADNATAPGDGPSDSKGVVAAPGNVTEQSETVAVDSAKGVRQPNDKYATRAAFLIPVSSTPLGAPPLSGRGRPLLFLRDEPNPPMPSEHREEDEAHNEAAPNATSTKQLLYHNAAVQTAPRVYLVFWGPNWFKGGDPYGAANRLHYFYQGLGGSTWGNVLKQFGSNYGSFTNPVGQYQGWTQDLASVPAHPTTAQLVAVVRRAAAYFNDFSYNAQYVIATPWGVVDQQTTQKHACAWHDWAAAGPSGHWITYTSLPYMPYLDALGQGCGGGKVNGANGKLDGVTIVASHEYGETVNDPSLAAWYDINGDENGDKCSWINLANYKLRNGYSLPVQPLWSNLWRKQYGNGCLYS